MKVCPNCGHEDPVCWHSYRWITDIDYSRFEDVLQFYPELADMKPGEYREDKHNWYRRTTKRNGGLYIYRWPKFYGKEYILSRFFEKFKAKRTHGALPHQKKLELEVKSS